MVDSAGNVGPYNSVALNGDGVPRISYLDVDGWRLKYAQKVNGAWRKEIADQEGRAGWHTPLAVDSQNKAHITYFEGVSKTLRYAREVD